MHKRRERGHILNLVQNASRTLAFTSWLLKDFEGRLRVRRGWLDVYSTQTTTKQSPRSIQQSLGLNDWRKGRDGVGRGDTVLGSKGSGPEGWGMLGWGLTQSACNGTRSAQAGKTRVGRYGSARMERYAKLDLIGWTGKDH